VESFVDEVLNRYDGGRALPLKMWERAQRSLHSSDVTFALPCPWHSMDRELILQKTIASLGNVAESPSPRA
jgi:hypothetical protein